MSLGCRASKSATRPPRLSSMTSALQWIDRPPVELHFPVEMRAVGEPGLADDRDHFAARDALADRHEDRARVVVTALEAAAVLHADSDPALAVGLPAGLRHNPSVRRDDRRPEGPSEVDAGVRGMEELR